MRRLRKWARFAGAVAILMGCLSGWAGATPTTQVWTPSVADVQPYKVWHLTYDTYFSVARKLNRGGARLPGRSGPDGGGPAL